MRRRAILRLLRLGNPVVRAVLRSRGHPLLSGRLALLEYVGRRSGRTFCIPVLYAEAAGALIVLAAMPERKQWWRTFRGSAPATLLVRGERQPVVGRLLDGRERCDALRIYLARFPRAATPLSTAGVTDADLDEARAAVVSFADPASAEL